jgi:SAM-dependent methyltransferase
VRRGAIAAVQSSVPDLKRRPALQELEACLAEEQASYAAALAELDRLAVLPEEDTPRLLAALAEANGIGPAARLPSGRGLVAELARRVAEALRPALERQARVEAATLRLLNMHVEQQARLGAGLRALAAGLVRYAQRVEPMMAARDRLNVATAPTDAHLAIASVEQRMVSVQAQAEGLLALRDRIEVLSEELRAVHSTLAAAAPPPEIALAAQRAASDSRYTAFENRFRGDREAVRGRQADYVRLFAGHAPVVDLGCGRGEFLDLLRSHGIAARGIEGSASAVQECRARGLDVSQGDLLELLCSQPAGSLGGLFAAQVAEHLPPPVLAAVLAEAHRVLREDGLLVLETVNAACGLAFLDVFIRDLTHERPLHPETLRFMVAAAGFAEVRIEMRSPVPADVRLGLLPSGALPPPVLKVLNENAERLNALLFSPLDYAVIARR